MSQREKVGHEALLEELNRVDRELKELQRELSDTQNQNDELTKQIEQKELELQIKDRRLDSLRARDIADGEQLLLEKTALSEKYSHDVTIKEDVIRNLDIKYRRFLETQKENSGLRESIDILLQLTEKNRDEHAISMHEKNLEMKLLREAMERKMRDQLTKMDISYQKDAFAALSERHKQAMFQNAKLKDEVALQGVGLNNLGSRLNKQTQQYEACSAELKQLNRKSRELRDTLGVIASKKNHITKEISRVSRQKCRYTNTKRKLLAKLTAEPQLMTCIEQRDALHVSIISAKCAATMWHQRLTRLQALNLEIKPTTEHEQLGRFDENLFRLEASVALHTTMNREGYGNNKQPLPVSTEQQQQQQQASSSFAATISPLSDLATSAATVISKRNQNPLNHIATTTTTASDPADVAAAATGTVVIPGGDNRPKKVVGGGVIAMAVKPSELETLMKQDRTLAEALLPLKDKESSILTVQPEDALKEKLKRKEQKRQMNLERLREKQRLKTPTTNAVSASRGNSNYDMNSIRRDDENDVGEDNNNDDDDDEGNKIQHMLQWITLQILDNWETSKADAERLKKQKLNFLRLVKSKMTNRNLANSEYKKDIDFDNSINDDGEHNNENADDDIIDSMIMEEEDNEDESPDSSSNNNKSNNNNRNSSLAKDIDSTIALSPSLMLQSHMGNTADGDAVDNNNNNVAAMIPILEESEQGSSCESSNYSSNSREVNSDDDDDINSGDSNSGDSGNSSSSIRRNSVGDDVGVNEENSSKRPPIVIEKLVLPSLPLLNTKEINNNNNINHSNSNSDDASHSVAKQLQDWREWKANRDAAIALTDSYRDDDEVEANYINEDDEEEDDSVIRLARRKNRMLKNMWNQAFSFNSLNSISISSSSSQGRLSAANSDASSSYSALPITTTTATTSELTQWLKQVPTAKRLPTTTYHLGASYLQPLLQTTTTTTGLGDSYYHGDGDDDGEVKILSLSQQLAKKQEEYQKIQSRRRTQSMRASVVAAAATRLASTSDAAAVTTTTAAATVRSPGGGMYHQSAPSSPAHYTNRTAGTATSSEIELELQKKSQADAESNRRYGGGYSNSSAANAIESSKIKLLPTTQYEVGPPMVVDLLGGDRDKIQERLLRKKEQKDNTTTQNSDDDEEGSVDNNNNIVAAVPNPSPEVVMMSSQSQKLINNNAHTKVINSKLHNNIITTTKNKTLLLDIPKKISTMSSSATNKNTTSGNNNDIASEKTAVVATMSCNPTSEQQLQLIVTEEGVVLQDPLMGKKFTTRMKASVAAASAVNNNRTKVTATSNSKTIRNNDISTKKGFNSSTNSSGLLKESKSAATLSYINTNKSDNKLTFSLTEKLRSSMSAMQLDNA